MQFKIRSYFKTGACLRNPPTLKPKLVLVDSECSDSSGKSMEYLVKRREFFYFLNQNEILT